MEILVTPDSFKGSLSARELCAAVKKGIHQVVPDAIVHEIPLADGGEGTLENILYATNGTSKKVNVKDPLGRPVTAAYGVLNDTQTAVIEMAQASGLPLLEETERNPLLASSYGTGELIKDALDQGYRNFIIGLGGSATNDGGTGLLKALGVRFYDKAGVELAEGGGALLDLHHFDDSALDARISESTFLVASDVTNPLCGDDGASAIFGPQKGATAEMIAHLDQALLNYGEIIKAQKGVDIVNAPGAGAAGGMGAGLLVFCGAQIKPGIDIMMDAVDFDKHLKQVSLIITGEGRLDKQTFSGKVISGVCNKAKSRNIPVLALCGGLELSPGQCTKLGLTAAFSIVPKPCELEEAFRHTAEWAENQTAQMIKLIQLSL
ncbi:glycerate kinase [Planococcus sp. YIM B11945]|uniref:glycerate kinase n=1 Tax=Planococcus sp. YIM B11945 TaxID=3435410 RepID=UPI003D7D74D9